MAKTKKELTNILNALTGETHAEHEFNSKADIIAEISKNTSGGGGGGGSDLPEHTAADNGKFLGVVEGDLAWAAAGGEEPFYVTFTVTNPETFEIGEVDKTFAEVAAADEAGKRIVGKFNVTVEGQTIEAFEADVAGRLILENGNGYVWQNIDPTTLTLIIYDTEGVHSSISGWRDIAADDYVKYATYTINDVATSDVICDTTPLQIWDWFDKGYSVRAKVRGINPNRDVYFDLGIINAAASDTYEIDFSGTYLDGTSLAWLNIHHESTGGNQAFALTKKTIETA